MVSFLAGGKEVEPIGQGCHLPSCVSRLTAFGFFVYRLASHRLYATSPPGPLSQGERGSKPGKPASHGDTKGNRNQAKSGRPQGSPLQNIGARSGDGSVVPSEIGYLGKGDCIRMLASG